MLHILHLLAASLDPASAEAVIDLTEGMDEPSPSCGERSALMDAAGNEVEMHLVDDVLTVGPHSLSVRSDHTRTSYDDGRLTIADEAVTIVLVADADLQTIEDGQFGFVLVEDEELVDA